jgi:predicted ester cyclase
VRGHSAGHAVRDPGGGRRLSFRLVHVFDMAPDGLIRRENVSIDLASIMQQLGATPAAS